MYVYTQTAARKRARCGRPVQAGEPVIFGSATILSTGKLSRVWEEQGYIKWEGAKMKRVCIIFETGNSSFTSDRRGEIAKVLEVLSQKVINNDADKISIMDSNGNQIGTMFL